MLTNFQTRLPRTKLNPRQQRKKLVEQIIYIQIYDTITTRLYVNPRKRRQKLDRTKLYMKIYDITTKGLLPNPRQQCHELVETIFYMNKNGIVFSYKMTHLKFVFVVSITVSALIVQVIKVDI